MKNYDYRIDKNLLRKVIGKTMNSYICDPFLYRNSVTQIVGLSIEDSTYKLTNIEQPVDYFGTEDDYSIFALNKCDRNEIRSAIVGNEQINTAINLPIRSITLINEHQQLSEADNVTFSVWLTRAAIFHFSENNEVMFQKDRVPFSEEIYIQRGYDLIKKVQDNDYFINNLSDGIMPLCESEIITLGRV